MDKGIIITGSGNNQVLIDTKSGESKVAEFVNFDCYVYKTDEDIFVMDTKGNKTTAKAGDTVVKIWCRDFVTSFNDSTSFVEVYNRFLELQEQKRKESKLKKGTLEMQMCQEKCCITSCDDTCCESSN